MLTKEIRDKLSAEIPQKEISWKPQVERGDRALMVAYVDARWVAERLDDAADGDWSFTWENLGLLGDRITIKGILTVCGVTRQDVGEHMLQDRGNIDPYKSAVSDALKRAAVLFGVGRELYRMESQWVKKADGKYPAPVHQKPPTRQPTQELTQEPEHEDWVNDPAIVKDFFSWTGEEKGLTNKEALEALGVTDINQYKGTKKDALVAINSYLHSR